MMAMIWCLFRGVVLPMLALVLVSVGSTHLLARLTQNEKKCETVSGQEAIDACTRLINLIPREANLYYNRGLAWSRKSDFDKAISDYSKALDINPRDDESFNNRGSAWFNKGDFEKAISDYGNALAVNPRNALAYSN